MSIKDKLEDMSHLFGWPNRLTNVRKTSKQAFKDITKNLILPTQEHLIVESLTHKRNYSLQEITKITGLSINAVSGRVNGLKKKGFLVEDEIRRCSVTGKKIKPVKLP